jgi:hypothetical protein
VLAHDPEAIVGGYSSGGDHRLMDDAADLLAMARALALVQVDSSVWDDAISPSHARTREIRAKSPACL